uniref:T-cell receptor alpha/delta variable 22.0 n=1 Tax=Lepisosteus oculatus TaxID=7918 RepID=W5MFP0_LEPOC
ALQIMEYKFLLTFAVVLVECGAEDTVTQSPESVNIAEGGEATLNCTYSTSSTSPSLFWYIQYRNDFPRIILQRDVSGYKDNAEGFKNRFDAELNPKSNAVPLTIGETALTDSAVYYCALRPPATKRYTRR